MRAYSVCSTPECSELANGGKCHECRKEVRKNRESNRLSATKRGYSVTWRKARARYLKYHPTCECKTCLELPKHLRPKAIDVHHIDEQGPDGPFGYKWFNLEALSKPCHSRITAKNKPSGWNNGRKTDYNR